MTRLLARTAIFLAVLLLAGMVMSCRSLTDAPNCFEPEDYGSGALVHPASGDTLGWWEATKTVCQVRGGLRM